jgi:hypothetical protein
MPRLFITPRKIINNIWLKTRPVTAAWAAWAFVFPDSGIAEKC